MSRAEIDVPIKKVSIDGQVILQIIRHCQSERDSTDLAQGVLLGMLVDNCTEVTYCFPFPEFTEADTDNDIEMYQLDMMKYLRSINMDHMQVGWYRASPFDLNVIKDMLDSQYTYQKQIHESVGLLFDPIKAAQGNLSMKAYRLSSKVMEMYGQGSTEFTVNSILAAGLSYENIFEEIPVEIRNSSLCNVYLAQLKLNHSSAPTSYLTLGTDSHLEKSLRLLSESLDELHQEAGKLSVYHKTLRMHHQKQQSLLKKRGDNAKARDDDDSKQNRPPPAPYRLDNLLVANQTNKFCQELNQYVSQSFSKLFLAEALENNES
ncbi:expressed hypothetical protein [Trichoplax adhaerens]|uniref:Eukaryotic translation initiation factor 3 subunit H n=1 Tax=Trichoplax adhaerens TaxID=10228 RepID=B3S1H3_TRIAD|nr:expressed hypothetical protein [Trichoplax adhaerens]EDV23225.1 expressed hypothetical protein [Trichoplax adhaerens]|eukprot:XP_002114135.1 expressed hypothetical protein [Trichoplax adhaerens]